MPMNDQDITIYNETINGEIRETKHSFTSDVTKITIKGDTVEIWKQEVWGDEKLVARYVGREWLDFKYEQIFAR